MLRPQHVQSLAHNQTKKDKVICRAAGTPVNTALKATRYIRKGYPELAASKSIQITITSCRFSHSRVDSTTIPSVFSESVKHLTKWHAKYKVPVVDGKIQNPNTGEIEDASDADFYYGPPSVQTTWLNTCGESDFRVIGVSFAATIDEVFVQIGEHLKNDVYSLVSVSASAYSMTIVCCSSKSQAEISETVGAIQIKLGRLVILPEEGAYWDALEKVGSEEKPKITGRNTAKERET